MNNSIRFPHVLSCELLVEMADHERARLIDDCALLTFQRPRNVMRQGEAADGFVFVVEGAVEVSYLSEEGNDSVVYVALPGDALGVVEGLSARPYAASCNAFAGTRLLKCSQAQLVGLISLPSFVRGFASYVHGLLDRDNRIKAMHQFFTSEQRIASYLFELSRTQADLRLSQSYLANVVGCSRQTVNRELGLLRAEGTIALGRSRIRVLDRPALLGRLKDMEDAIEAAGRA